jgi:F0F1-type ATP synthase assembly protein I
LTLGLNLAGTVGAGLVIGLVIDSVAHSAPWGLLGGLFLGSVGAATALASLLRRWK